MEKIKTVLSSFFRNTVNDIKGIPSGLAALPDKVKKSRWRFYLCAFAFPAVLTLLMYLVRGLYPIGDGSVLVLDLNAQ